MFRLFLKEKVKSSPKKPTTSDATSRRNRRAFERFPVDHKHLTMMNEQDILLIVDISKKGFSSKVSSRTYERLNVGDVFTARIRYVGEIYDLEARVSWKHEDLTVGFALDHADQRTMAFLQRIIEPIALASSMQKVETNFMKDNTDGKIWYHGDHDTDLYVWRDYDLHMTAWQLVHSDVFIDWDSMRGLRTGQLAIAEESISGILDVSKKSLKQILDPMPNNRTKQLTVDILIASSFEDKDDILETLVV